MHTDKHRHASIHAYIHIRRDRDWHTDIKKQIHTTQTRTDRHTHAHTYACSHARMHTHTCKQTVLG